MTRLLHNIQITAVSNRERLKILETFETTLERSNAILKCIDERFGWGDRERAYLAFRAVFQGLRDRLAPEPAATLAAELPALLRGVYYEGWQPSDTPQKGGKDEFIAAVEREIDALSYTQSTEEMIAGTVAASALHLRADALRTVIETLPRDVRSLVADDLKGAGWPSPPLDR